MDKIFDNPLTMKAFAGMVLLLILLSLPLNVFAQGITVADLPDSNFRQQFNRDLRALRSYTENMEKTVQVMITSRLFEKGRTNDFDIREKEALSLLWGNYLDHMFAFETLVNFYKSFYRLGNKRNNEDAFLIAYATYLTRHANSLKIIKTTIDNELYEKTLDDFNPDYGIPAGMYGRLKWNTIHVKDLSGIIAGYDYYRFFEKSYKKRGIMDAENTGWIFQSIHENYGYVMSELKQKGPRYFAANGLDLVKEKTFTAWFPFQMGVSEWMGNTKVKRMNSTLIRYEQINEMQKHLNPGDIIVERRNWYLSNIGLPGFWPHAELFIGTYADMKTFFADAAVTAYYKMQGPYRDFIDYLEKKYPERIATYRSRAHDGYPYQIIEAVSSSVHYRKAPPLTISVCFVRGYQSWILHRP